MQILTIDETVLERIAEVIGYANNHIYSIDDQLDRYNKEMKPPGDEPGFVVIIPIGFKVVYCLEESPDGKLVRDLSMSVPQPGKLPSVPITEEIIKHFGFIGGLAACFAINLELIGPSHHAIRMMQYVNP